MSYLCLKGMTGSQTLRLGLLGMTILGRDSTAMPLRVLRSSSVLWQLLTQLLPWQLQLSCRQLLASESMEAVAQESNWDFSDWFHPRRQTVQAVITDPRRTVGGLYGRWLCPGDRAARHL